MPKVIIFSHTFSLMWVKVVLQEQPCTENMEFQNVIILQPIYAIHLKLEKVIVGMHLQLQTM